MVQRAVNNYYKFFDETLESTTFVVLMITLIVFMVWTIIPNASAYSSRLKTSVLDVQNSDEDMWQFIEIDGEKYEIKLLKMK